MYLIRISLTQHIDSMYCLCKKQPLCTTTKIFLNATQFAHDFMCPTTEHMELYIDINYLLCYNDFQKAYSQVWQVASQ